MREGEGAREIERKIVRREHDIEQERERARDG